jgi:hypothetical protein
MAAQADEGAEHAVAGSAGSGATATHDLFIVHAPADAEFVRGYLVPAVNLPPDRVLLSDALPLGGMLAAEIDQAVTRSRFSLLANPAPRTACTALARRTTAR